ncbi:unnamed protein product [Notodromas monacha]|uniref:PHD finger protein 12 n=1 Tax=Notodromas monacha TaxID=399045 RepID=A0A7R9BKX9_9CRUS|nr:unnamed protein product [Notodromas monacha]CAG0915905.1 unnamed protein product [Notodromas monacha]
MPNLTCGLTVPVNTHGVKDLSKDRLLPLIRALCDPPGEWENVGEPDEDHSLRGDNSKSLDDKQKSSSGARKQEVWANFDFCVVCGRGGQIICCELCPRSFHLTCLLPPLKEKDIPEGDWICTRCTEIKRRSESGEPIPSSLQRLLPVERKCALEAAEKLKQRPERSGRFEEKPKAFRRRKYAYDGLLADIKKYRRETQKELDEEADYLKSLVTEAEKLDPEPPVEKKVDQEEPKPKEMKISPVKVPKTPKKQPILNVDTRIHLPFSTVKTRRKVVGSGEKAILDSLDEILCCATDFLPQDFQLHPNVKKFCERPLSFTEPSNENEKSANKKQQITDQCQSCVNPSSTTNVSGDVDLTEMDVDDDGIFNQYLEDMKNKPPSPAFNRKTESHVPLGNVKGTRTNHIKPVDKVTVNSAHPPGVLKKFFEDPESSVLAALNKIKLDLPLMNLKKYQVLHGVPRLFPANIFPGEPRRDSSYGGNEIKPVLIAEHVRRAERGKGPLLCSKCHKGCLKKALLQCDYCPLYYHLECLEPPMMEPPKYLWMCPQHAIRPLEKKLWRDCRRSSRIKLWRREISLPVNESSVILDFFRRAKSHSVNSSEGPMSRPLKKIQIHPALINAYCTKSPCDSERFTTDSSSDAALASAEDAELFMGVIQTMHAKRDRLMDPDQSQDGQKCHQVDESIESQSADSETVELQKPGPSGVRIDTSEEQKDLMLEYKSSDDHGDECKPVSYEDQETKDLLAAESSIFTELMQACSMPDLENIEVEDLACDAVAKVMPEIKVDDDVLSIGWGEEVTKPRRIPPESVTCRTEKEFEALGRRLLLVFQMPTEIGEGLPWGTLREIRVSLATGVTSKILLEKPKSQLPSALMSAVQQLSVTLPIGKNVEPNNVEGDLLHIPPTAENPVEFLLGHLSPELKENLLRKYLSSLVFNELKPREKPKDVKISLAEVLENRAEFKLGREPFAVIAPISPDGSLAGELIPVFDASFSIGVSPHCLLSLDAHAEGKCQFVSSYHAEVMYIKRENRFECLNYSRYGTFVDDQLYGFATRDNLCSVTDGFRRRNDLCKCGVLPQKKAQGITGWNETAAELHNGSVLRFGCLEYLFVIPGKTSVLSEESVNDDADSGGEAEEAGDCGMENEAACASDTEEVEKETKFSPRKTRSMIQIRINSAAR